MKNVFRSLALMLALLLPAAVFAQVVTQLPVAVTGGTIKDLGNGPLELKVIQGNLQIFTSQGSGTGSTSGSSTNLTLTATPSSNPPCVGCGISGSGITAGTTVASYNGTTTIGLSAAMTVPASTAVAWGAACPSSIGSISPFFVQAAVGGDWPLYTYARICAGNPFSPGATILPFAIGAH